MLPSWRWKRTRAASSASADRRLLHEANTFLTGTAAADYVRSLLLKILDPNVGISDPEKNYAKKMLIAFTDAKSLESTIVKDSGQSIDKQVKILIVQMKEMIGVSHYEDDEDMSRVGGYIANPCRCAHEAKVRKRTDFVCHVNRFLEAAAI